MNKRGSAIRVLVFLLVCVNHSHPVMIHGSESFIVLKIKLYCGRMYERCMADTVVDGGFFQTSAERHKKH